MLYSSLSRHGRRRVATVPHGEHDISKIERRDVVLDEAERQPAQFGGTRCALAGGRPGANLRETGPEVVRVHVGLLVFSVVLVVLETDAAERMGLGLGGGAAGRERERGALEIVVGERQ
ncbi:MAG: hypothetical protein R3B70_41120 [Polyangiaceae bacterium]